jgi:hypothetical protein
MRDGRPVMASAFSRTLYHRRAGAYDRGSSRLFGI